MTTTSTAGIETTYPYETTSPGVARHQCEECGSWSRSDDRGGRIRHGRRCDSQPQPEIVAQAEASRTATVDRDTDLRVFGASVRRTGLTKGRDEDVLEAVRQGHLSVDAAMNTDD